MRAETAPTADGRAKHYRLTFDSVADFADSAVEKFPDLRDRGHGDNRPKFTGVETCEQAHALALSGWADELPAALAVADSAVTKVEREHTVPTFRRVIGTRGKRADIGRFMAGQPECMVSLVPSEVIRAGRVIALVASVSRSGAVSQSAIVRRGRATVALALALERLGYAVEIWADWSNTAELRAGNVGSMRVAVKTAHDALDPASVLYALAHPSFMRVLGFANAYHSDGYRSVYSHAMGYPTDPIEDMPEGTIYLPCILSDRDVPDADVELLNHLRKLGIVTD